MLKREIKQNAPKSSALLIMLISAAALLVCGCGEKPAALDWPAVSREHRPWTRWWWMGSAVNKADLTRLLQQYREVDLGGVEITPIYGVKDCEDRFIDYLSPQWMELLRHTIEEAERLDLGVDMATGTGWPFGGPQVKAEDAAARVTLQTYTLETDARLDARLDQNALQALMAYGDDGRIVDLTAKVGEAGLLDWVAPPGRWELYAVSQAGTGQRVKRAAPGGEGSVLDHFSAAALSNYLARFDSAFADYRGGSVRAFFNDSFEVYDADWTDDLFAEFQSRRGYDLRRQLPALAGQGPPDTVARVKSDYRETIADLLLERFTGPWVAWSHKKGSLARNQAHGSPGNLLDLYAAVDMPETEIFGPSGFEIPGLRVDPDFSNVPPDVLVLKFASSAAHVSGKRLVSSESATWLGEHFRVALSQVKPEIDLLLVTGINHVVYHGTAYSPPEEPWPGWLFYASTNFAPTNSFWRDLPELNAYIARCQSILQAGQPANDVLLYFPIHDIWHHGDGTVQRLGVHNLERWLYGSYFHQSARTLWDRGYTFDYVSDRLLSGVRYSKGRLRSGDAAYRVIVVPQCRFMPLNTLERLLDLADAGATIAVHGQLPSDVPGFGELAQRREQFNQALSALQLEDTGSGGVRQAAVGKGRLLVGEDLEQLLRLAGVSREPLVDAGLRFIRRTHGQGYHYFLANLGPGTVEDWVPLGVAAKSAVIFDPRTSERGVAARRRGERGETQVYLQLLPGESLILRTFSERQVNGPQWSYLRVDRSAPVELQGPWRVTFVEGGPRLPAGFETDRLASWTELGDTVAQVFAGTACYTTTFNRPAGSVDEWVLDLGRVYESARIRVNGQYAGTLWCLPSRMPVGEYLHEGENVLEVEVTNLTANRIADMDRRGVPWRKFYDINFVNINYEKFDASDWPLMDAGLLGPVHLVPAVRIKP